MTLLLLATSEVDLGSSWEFPNGDIAHEDVDSERQIWLVANKWPIGKFLGTRLALLAGHWDAYKTFFI